MKNVVLTLGLMLLATTFIHAEENIKLDPPQKKKGLSVMQALSERKSTREFSSKELSVKDLSNLLWAANGINRPDGKRTAPSAMNKQEIDVYACLKTGAYFYNPGTHTLEFVSEGNCLLRNAPVTLYLVANADKPEGYPSIDTGIVSQNISVFASGMGFVTVPQGSMNKEEVSKILKLKNGQHLILNHPVGYPADKKK